MPHVLLGRTLAANGLFSFLSGAMLTLVPGRIGSLLGIEQSALLRAIGIGLLGFGVVVLLQSMQSRRRMTLVLAITLADVLWVVGTLVLLASLAGAFSETGVVLIGAVAAVIAGFAVAEFRGISRAYAVSAGGGGGYRVCLEVLTSADPRSLWTSLRDLARIADFAPGLESSRLRNGGEAGPGTVRECHAVNGSRWAERCTALDDSQRRVEMEFLTHEPGFPFPFHRMAGGWEINHDASGSRVRVWWEVHPKAPWLAPMILPVMEQRAARDIARTVNAMAARRAERHSGVRSGRRHPRRVATAC